MSRLPVRLFVDALLRATQTAGGFAMVLRRGDADGGALLIQCRDRSTPGPLLERQFDGLWQAVGPDQSADATAQEDYVARRRRIDPDLWLIELDIPDAPQFIAALNPKA